MTYDNVKLFFGATRRLVIHAIIVALMIGIFSTLMIGIRMTTAILTSNVLQISKNYKGFSN
jgi:hypothetical protein